MCLIVGTLGAHIDQIAEGLGGARGTPLMLACMGGSVEVVRTLLHAGVRVDEALVSREAKLRRGSGAEVNYRRTRLNMNYCKRSTPAEKVPSTRGVPALANGPTIIHATLLLHGTSLHLAAHRGHHGVVCELLRAGAAVDAVDDDRLTALFIAVHKSNLEIVQALLRGGADPNHRAQSELSNTEGSFAFLTPLALAAKTLAENGSSAEDGRGRDGTSGALECAFALLDSGAMLNRALPIAQTTLLDDGRDVWPARFRLERAQPVGVSDAASLHSLMRMRRERNQEVVCDPVADISLLIEHDQQAQAASKADMIGQLFKYFKGDSEALSKRTCRAFMRGIGAWGGIYKESNWDSMWPSLCSELQTTTQRGVDMAAFEYLYGRGLRAEKLESDFKNFIGYDGEEQEKVHSNAHTMENAYRVERKQSELPRRNVWRDGLVYEGIGLYDVSSDKYVLGVGGPPKYRFAPVRSASLLLLAPAYDAAVDAAIIAHQHDINSIYEAQRGTTTGLPNPNQHQISTEWAAF